MIRFDEDSYALEILKVIALSGEFPFNFLDHINSDRNKIIYQRTIRKLKEEKYVTVSGNGELKTIRMTRKGLETLKQYDEDSENYLGYYEHYMFVSNNHHFRAGVYKNKDDVGKRQTMRRHRLAEAMWLMRRIDAEILPNEKPELSLKNPENRIEKDEMAFYTSIEIKNLDKEQKYKTEFTRILGVLYSPGGIYSIYNTNKGKMKWNNQGEQKAKVLVDDITRTNYLVDSDKSYDINNSIIIGKDINLMNEILKSNDGKRDSNGFELLSFNNSYDNIYYITLDNNGYIQLVLITRDNWKERMRLSILPKEALEVNPAYLSIDCDAYDKKTETFYLIFHDGNIARLRRFKEAMYGSEKKFKVYCFEFQEEAVAEYLEGMAEIEVVELDDFINEFTNIF